jgi:hypothetical protein
MGIAALIRRWWSPPKIDPNQPHQFRSIDSASAAAAGEVGGGIYAGPGQAALLAMSGEATREKCQLRGCNRPAGDPIHA